MRQFTLPPSLFYKSHHRTVIILLSRRSCQSEFRESVAPTLNIRPPEQSTRTRSKEQRVRTNGPAPHLLLCSLLWPQEFEGTKFGHSEESSCQRSPCNHIRSIHIAEVNSVIKIKMQDSILACNDPVLRNAGQMDRDGMRMRANLTFNSNYRDIQYYICIISI